MRRKKRRTKKGMFAIGCMAVVLIVVMGVQIIRLYEKQQTLLAQQQELQSQLEEEEERTEELEALQEYMQTDAYIEDTARTRLGMVYEDEILFKEE